MAQHLLAPDTLNGASGSIVVNVGGKNQVVAGMRNIQITGEIEAEEMRVIGTKKVQQKQNGVTLAGSGNIYYGTNLFTDMVLDYINNGITTEFSIQVTNNDPATSVGTQTIAVYGCTLTGEIPIAILDSEEAMLNYDFEFTYSSIERLQAFNEPTRFGN